MEGVEFSGNVLEFVIFVTWNAYDRFLGAYDWVSDQYGCVATNDSCCALSYLPNSALRFPFLQHFQIQTSFFEIFAN